MDSDVMPALGDTPGGIGNGPRRLIVSNARHVTQGIWGVRYGSRYYPDYAAPHPTAWDGNHGGRFLTPDEADELAEHLRRVAAWARAQNALDAHDA